MRGERCCYPCRYHARHAWILIGSITFGCSSLPSLRAHTHMAQVVKPLSGRALPSSPFHLNYGAAVDGSLGARGDLSLSDGTKLTKLPAVKRPRPRPCPRPYAAVWRSRPCH